MLEPREELGAERPGVLGRVRLGPDPVHHTLEYTAVIFYLTDQVLEIPSEVGASVRFPAALREPDTGGGPSEVVVQVRAQRRIGVVNAVVGPFLFWCAASALRIVGLLHVDPLPSSVGFLPGQLRLLDVSAWLLSISVVSGRRDSNPRPLAPKASALPGCATPRGFR